MGQEIQENKENDLMVSAGDNWSVIMPQTPVHLLKRTHSNVLKPSGDKRERRSRSTSPMKRVGRLPLASKDHNRAAAWGPVKKRQPTLQGDILSNPRKLQKYGSVLGYNELPRTKSLVLKDAEEEEEEAEEEGELQKKLRDALSKQDESTEGLNSNGLSQLVRDAKDEVEFAPQKVAELEYVPDGVPLFGAEEIGKLNTVNLGMWKDSDESETETEIENESGNEEENEAQNSQMLPLQKIKSGGSDHEKTHNARWRRLEPKVTQASTEADFDYNGDGLTAEELEELLR
ncbi:PDS1 (YDR113C) [Zygosaccharomyces parabailii]|uniref:ZYBA0S03-00958g1_1 n=1 Tax=Zygosaccharomyces bailii (strain CLIB 213 / ATCC 58445 / CBS 680 / BCRC 21525 / NBRC 1098 / NCYC 1416 / NRRL Y-2227) TaxID=1333698 RepID=A0A8J2X9N6_ZYGB2|nr:PDS1 (YDR113C) [Zygosaccharomyces parabailii]CDF88744.1 ZYBA0S03-00958g1_1 [Zygosaccharomyces bailii CLIB 213]CDH15833.1 uncharacterized protein ZBAI_07620 [Zygosaccharomyces bailii ISA1307]